MKIKWKIENSIILFFSYYSVLRIITGIFPDSLRKLIIVLLLSLIYIPIICFTRKKFKLDSFLVVLLLMIYIYITYLLHKEYYNILFKDINNIWKNVVTFNSGIFGYCIARNIKKYTENELNYGLRTIAWLIFIGNVWRPSEVLKNGYWLSDEISKRSYNQSFSFEIIIPGIIFLYLFLKEKKISEAILALICMIENLIWGSRSSIVVYVIFIVIYEVAEKHLLLNPKKVVIAFMFCVFVLLSYFSDVASIIIQKFQFLGFNTRSLRIFSASYKIDDSGRYSIWKESLKLIKNGPIFGYGIYGDQYYMNGQWCHNIILEILFDFGIIVGSIIILLLGLIVFKMFFKCNNHNYKILFIISFSISFGKLLVSSSFWFDTFFWVSLALFVNECNRIKNSKFVQYKMIREFESSEKI